jgi:Uncharacterised protein family UPF0047
MIGGRAMQGSSSSIATFAPEIIATATIVVHCSGRSFTDITDEARRFVVESGAKDGALFLFVRHTSASLVVQKMPIPMCEAILRARSIASHPPMHRGFTMSRGPMTCRRT